LNIEDISKNHAENLKKEISALNANLKQGMQDMREGMIGAMQKKVEELRGSVTAIILPVQL